MNFRELFSKLDGIAEGGVTLPNPDGTNRPGAFTAQDQIALNQRVQAMKDAENKAAPSNIPPGAQPSLGPKTEPALTPKDLKALQFPNQKPDAQPAVVTDPKADVNAMAQALKAVAGAQQTAQPPMQPTTSASISQQQAQANGPKEIDAPKPGEPVKETIDAVNEEMTRAEYLRRQAEYDNMSPAQQLLNTNPKNQWDAQQAALQGAKDAKVKDWLAVVGADPSKLDSIKNDELRNAVWAKMPKQQQAKYNEYNKAQASAQEEKNRKAAEEKTEKERNEKEAQDKKDGKKPADDGKKPADDGKKPVVDPNADSKKPADDGKKPVDGEKQPPAKRTWNKGVLGKGIGMSGEPNAEVKALQDRLAKADPKYLALLGGEAGIDGRYGPNTAAAVTQFQNDYNEKNPDNKIKVDGAAGGQTLPLINKLTPAEVKPTEVKPTEVKPTEVKPTEVKPTDPVKAARDRLAQIEADKQAVDDEDFKNKYKDIDPKSVIRQTGNMNKAYYDLKGGEVDYDKYGQKHVYQKNGMGGPGNWVASHDSFADWQKTPGLGVVGPKWDSEEGQKIIKDRQARLLDPEAQKKYDRLFPQQPATATAVAEPKPAVVDPTAREKAAANNVAGVTTDDATRQAAALDAGARSIASKASNTELKEMSEQLHSLADELINETK